MSRLNQTIMAFALMLMPIAVQAEDAQIAALTQQIAANPSDKNLYNKRSQLYHAAGQHQQAIADLEKSCQLEADKDVAELCMMEVKDYAATYHLQR